MVPRSISLQGLASGLALVVGLSDFRTIKPSDYRHTMFGVIIVRGQWVQTTDRQRDV